VTSSPVTPAPISSAATPNPAIAHGGNEPGPLGPVAAATGVTRRLCFFGRVGAVVVAVVDGAVVVGAV
jgi:hypothetical protein